MARAGIEMRQVQKKRAAARDPAGILPDQGVPEIRLLSLGVPALQEGLASPAPEPGTGCRTCQYPRFPAQLLSPIPLRLIECRGSGARRGARRASEPNRQGIHGR